MATQWRGQNQVKANMLQYGRDVRQAVINLMQYWAATIEADAKSNAPWTDRTGNARQALYTLVDDSDSRKIILYLSHGMEYGVWLELKHQGRYAIVLPTLERHYADIERSVKGLLK